ncbi:cystatin-B-like [Planoprotostelium fungivorum]|uniref:Cystatin-B-like n=1 Tax=Planoprotostelium fungivorum TaxID=1890364 RepID=A0A2P6N2Z4_9EUKA|nr:cystatin-B-like [Planoprotostelium fungivorum]
MSSLNRTPHSTLSVAKSTKVESCPRQLSKKEVTQSTAETTNRRSHTTMPNNVPGGVSDVLPADDTAIDVANRVKSQVEEKTSRTFSTYQTHSYAKQVVAGMNYFIKIKVGDNEFIHVRVFRSLQAEYSVHGLQEGKTESDELAYF